MDCYGGGLNTMLSDHLFQDGITLLYSTAEQGK